MKKLFRKISALGASALLTGMTMGVAAAANYPAPFVVGSAADVAIVYGTGSGVSSLDVVEAGNIQADLSSALPDDDDGNTVISGDAWEAGTSSDDLELGESLKDIENYIAASELGVLADGTLSNEKGAAKYKQYFYFEDTTSSMVNYYEDEDENIGLFFKVNSGEVIARYVMDFTTNLESDIETDGELSDIEDKTIDFLGKTYTIVDATNGTSGVEMTLMGGALTGTINNDEELTLDGYTVSATVSSSTEVKFTINGEVTDKMNKGDTYKLADGNYLAVTDITYESYAGGLHAATFYIGADKMVWKNGSSMEVNAETISNSKPVISHTESGGDISISEISINMTAEDDLYVAEDGKLSEATDLDYPQVLVAQNWDIEFKGLETQDQEEIKLYPYSSDKKYKLKFQNADGDEVILPLIYTNDSGTYGGEKASKEFKLNPNASIQDEGVDKDDYFLIHTADPTSASNNAKTYLIQYKGADDVAVSSPKAKFDILGVEDNYEMDVTKTGSNAGQFTLKVGGGTFVFNNLSTATTDDFRIQYVGQDYIAHASDGKAEAVTAYIRTYYNTLITIADTNLTNSSDTGTAAIRGSNWQINVSVDDTNRDDDDATLSEQIFYVTIGNATSADATASFSGDGNWISDPDNSDDTLYMTRYGADISRTDPTDSPATVTVMVPKAIARPLVYISSGEISVTSGGGGGALGNVLVKDNEVSSVSSKNLIIVGGSCINTAAATALGVASGTCGSDFTSNTGVGAGQFLIKGVDGAFSTGKLALVVAGYEAADTVNAATYLRTQVVDTSAEYQGTSSTSATMVVA